MERIIEKTHYIGSGNSAGNLWRRTPQVVLVTFIYFLAMQFPDMSSAQAVIPLLTPLPQDISNKLDEQAKAAIKRSPVRSKTVKAVTHMGIDNAFFQQPLVILPAGTPAFEFNLPGITPILFEVETVRQEKNNRIILTGVTTNFGRDNAFLIVDSSNNSISGEIRVGKLRYEILPVGQGAHSIYTFDERLFPPDHDPRTKGTKPVSKALDDGPQNAVPVRFPTVVRHGDSMRKDAVVTLVSHGSGPKPIIDVMVLFTPQAASAFSPNDINEAIEIARERMVDSLIRSGIHADVNVVSKRCIGSSNRGEYESGSLDDELGQLQVDPQVDAWRKADGADLVVLWVNDGGLYCGLSFDLADNVIPILPSRAEQAFSIVNAQCILSDNNAFAHELGHQLGLFHDRVAAGANGDPKWNYGFVSPTVKDIMAEDPRGCGSDCPTRVNEWSNGRNLGVPIGAPIDGDTKDGPANNVAALNESIPIAAKFSPTTVTSTVICSSCPCPPSGP